MSKKLNGYIKWIALILTLLAILWHAAETNAILRNDIKHISEDIVKIEQRLEKIEERLWIERGKE